MPDEDAQSKQTEAWREEIQAAKQGKVRPPSSPREFTRPARRDPAKKRENENDDASKDD